MFRRPRPQVRPRLEVLEARQLLATFLVTSTADSGAGTLRQAILDANADAGPSGGAAVETIHFAIPGDGVQTIAPATSLPTMTQPTVVDATTQPGYAGTPLIVLDGEDAVDPSGAPVVGLHITPGSYTDGTEVAGLEIIQFSGSGIVADASGTSIHNVVIGTDQAGGQDLGNGGYGIKFNAGSNTVSESVIAYSGLRAIGGRSDQPGQPSDRAAFTTQNVDEESNDTAATQLVVRAAAGRSNAYTNPTVGAEWGGSVTLTYIISNTGSQTANNITLDLGQDYLYKLLTVISATTSQGTINPFQPDAADDYPGFAALGSLAPGASAVLNVTVQIGSEADHAGQFGLLSVAALSPQLDYDPSTALGLYNVAPSATGVLDPPNSINPAPANPAPNLVLATPLGTYDDYYVPLGSIQTLVYTVTNTGSADATNVAVSFHQAIFSHLASVLTATSTQGTLSPNFNLDDDTNDIATIGTLAPGESASVIITAQISAEDDGESDIINAVVTSDQNPATVPPNNALYTLTPDLLLTTQTGTGTGTGTGAGTGTGDIPPVEPTPIVVTAPVTPNPTESSGLASPEIFVRAVADLVVTGTAPVGARAGSAGLFVMKVRNAGSTTATDAVVALNLSALPAGSFYSILTQASTGAAGKVTPVVGRPGVYLVDLGALDPGASAVVDVMVIPKTGGLLSLVMAASDATAPTLDPHPADNVVYLGTTLPSTTPLPTASMVAPGVIQVATTSAVTKAQAENLANYQLTTTTGSDPTASTTTVSIRSAAYNERTHRVLLRLAHPLPVTATQAHLAVTGLGSTGTTTLDLVRYDRG